MCCSNSRRRLGWLRVIGSWRAPLRKSLRRCRRSQSHEKKKTSHPRCDGRRRHLRRTNRAKRNRQITNPQKPTKAVGSKTAVSSSSKPAVATASEPPKSTVEQIPAISDADGPEPRPYTYDMKAEEEQAFRKKMLALAGTEIARYANQFESPE